MKVGCLGGIENGHKKNALDYRNKSDLRWEIECEKPMEQSQLMAAARGLPYPKDVDTYKLMLLTRDDEQKFFYVLNSLEKSEIERLSSEFWDKSDVIGYVFN